ncbi:hypothetical protein THAOC_32225 [Thalassiosira oceanica]|uniref:Uncharacterized protein n=1 Tax=Thalassiosira oceanica TaxID=159749 RepID=K0R6F5_THAOC|nr:hypothetical protein THAOC_32225 [Thalassiosira oceanica]|eukprot:EJK48938.1 hypothetical protein THAOC_32225 [Thalassiosira oceanica]
MTSEKASPDDYVDRDAALPQRPSPPSDVSAGSAQETGGGTDVDHSTAAPLLQNTTQHGVTASTVRVALNDDDTPIPLLYVVDHEKAAEGPQLHDGPPGPPCSISHGFDDSRRKKVDNDAERQLPDSAQDSTPTVDSTMGASMTKASVAVGDVEEGNVSSGGTAPPMSSRTGEVAATAAVGRDAPPAWRSTSEPQTILPFYQRQSFVSNITCTFFVIGLAVAMGMLLLSNIHEHTTTNVSSSNQMKTPTLSPAPSNIPTNLPTRPLVGTSQKLLAPGGAAEDYFLRSAAIYENTIVVGAYNGDDNTGSAHVFVRSGEEWEHQAKLLAPDGAAIDYFGRSVSIYEDTIVVGALGTVVVGAWKDDDNGELSGSAHVFVRSGERWTHEAKLLAPDGAVGDWFGDSVAIHGDIIVAGAWGDNDIGRNSGSANVFARSGEEWKHQAKLLAPNGAAYDYFGRSVAIYDEVIVVGAYGDDDNGDRGGSAHVFVRSGEEWRHQAKLLAPDGALRDKFGESVAIYGDEIVVGAKGDDLNHFLLGSNIGSAHVYVQSGEEWTHQAKLLAPDGAAGDYFGNSVAIYKDTIVVSSPFDDDNKESAHVFVRSGDEWIHQTKLLPPDGAFHDLLGESVAIYQDTIVVVATGGDGNGNISGSSHVFVV